MALARGLRLVQDRFHPRPGRLDRCNCPAICGVHCSATPEAAADFFPGPIVLRKGGQAALRGEAWAYHRAMTSG